MKTKRKMATTDCRLCAAVHAAILASLSAGAGADFVVAVRARAVRTAVTIVVTFYGHVRGFNESAVDLSEGIKTRGPRTNYERGINRARPKLPRNFSSRRT